MEFFLECAYEERDAGFCDSGHMALVERDMAPSFRKRCSRRWDIANIDIKVYDNTARKTTKLATVSAEMSTV